jgi:hypothetical protein
MNWYSKVTCGQLEDPFREKLSEKINTLIADLEELPFPEDALISTTIGALKYGLEKYPVDQKFLFDAIGIAEEIIKGRYG